ncbi:MAG: sigma-70 family RNA polymerase sigma factor [Actinomycetia bacterium]|nr:sigma-70 family RNA polymerase sigma factor [Actinomycetes bacterium]
MEHATEPIPVVQVVQFDAATEPATPFDTLYHREYHAMVRMATALVDFPEKAEEVVQEAFAQLYIRYAQVDNPVAYVRVSVLNGCRRALRRRRLARALHATSQRDAEDSGELGFNHMLDAVRRLPTNQRNAVTLRYELQLTDAEISTTLGMPLGTVKSTLHRALTRLRTEVQR